MPEFLEQFKIDLAASDDQTMIDKYYHAGPSAVLDTDQVARLRRAIADQFDVGLRHVIVTGSAQLGFTTVRKKDRPIFSAFGETSDIDVAIVSTELFAKYWKLVFDYQIEHGDNWHNSNSFRKFFVRGWMRPDKLPTGENFTSSQDWFDFFRELTSSGDYGQYKISAGIYQSEYFWDQYASLAFNQCRMELEKNL